MALGAYTIINVNEAIQMLSRTRSRRSASLIRLPTPVNGEAGGGDFMPTRTRRDGGGSHRPAPWYSRRNMSSSDAGVTVKSMIPSSDQQCHRAVEIDAVDREDVVAVGDREVVDERGLLELLGRRCGCAR